MKPREFDRCVVSNQLNLSAIKGELIQIYGSIAMFI